MTKKLGEQFYQAIVLIRKESIEKKRDRDGRDEFMKRSRSGVIYDALRDHGFDVVEVSVHAASYRTSPEQIVLDVSGNGESTRQVNPDEEL